jgi:tRNA dimethylallyltransferase
MAPWLIAVMGPTGAGKTDLAEALADRLDAQLVNADAFQVYRGMDIGTNKPPNRDRYRLLDLVEPSEPFGVGEWVRLARGILEELFARGQSAVFVGGTGLYIRALFEEYAEMGEAPPPEVRARVDEWRRAEGLEGLLRRLEPFGIPPGLDRKNPVRVSRALERALYPSQAPPVRLPPFRKRKIAISVPSAQLEERVLARTREYVQNGWVSEVEGLRSRGIGEDAPGMRAIGYRTLLRHLDGGVDREKAIAEIVRDTMRYAKRQRTWLRSEPGLVWIGAQSRSDLLAEALHSLEFD